MDNLSWQRIAHVGSWDWELGSNKLTWSDELYRIFGVAPAEFSPSFEGHLAQVHPDDRSMVREAVQRALHERTPFTVDYRIIRPDGTVRVVDARGEVTLDDAGEPTRMIGTAQDVTERTQSEEQLKQARANAEAASESKSEFLANMSHEIRTPMTGVLGAISLLLESELTAQQHELADIVRNSGENLLNVINDILDFSKVEAGKLDIELIRFDMLKVVEEASALMSIRAAEKNISLIVRYPLEVPRHLVGDPGRIRQVLINLLANAINFTERGQVTVNVEGRPLSEEQASLRVSVEDTGIGIPEAKRQLIFEKFKQADASTTRRHGGTGLGLTISTQLVELMGGAIGVDSVEGKGSTFWFTLTLSLQEEGYLPEPPMVYLTGTRALIVDDNAVNRRVLNDQMRGWKMRTEVCASGDEALTALREAHAAGDPFDLAIIDSEMPGMDGEALGRAIKADPTLKNIALVMLSSAGEAGDASRFRDVGFAAYVVKPVRQSDLLATLLEVWARQVAGQFGEMVTRHGWRAIHKTVAPAHPRFNARVLLAEDNLTAQTVTAMMLRNLGCSVDVAGNGREAVERLDASTYDIVFMDCEMPEMDGLEATAVIRARGDERSLTPIVAVTAQVMPADRERCLRAGMSDYLPKPIQPEGLTGALQRWAPQRFVGNGGMSEHEKAGHGGIPRSLAVNGAAEPALDIEVIGRLRELAEATDAGLLGQICETFRGDVRAGIVGLTSAAEAGDSEQLRRQAHRLKGAAGSMGALRVMDLAEALQQLGEGGAIEGARELIARIEEEFVRVQAELDELLKQPAPSQENSPP